MDAKQYAPATQRNREPILEILKRILPPESTILEIASGTGEHAVFFASKLSSRRWIPSDFNPLLRDSINAWREESDSVTNLEEPLAIDVNESQWEIETKDIKIDAIVNINMIHISPWKSCLGLMAGAGRILSSGGILYLYGPFKQKGEHTASSNVSFDESLRRQNPEWGVRDLEAVARIANSEGFTLEETIAMPANNLSVVFKRK